MRSEHEDERIFDGGVASLRDADRRVVDVALACDGYTMGYTFRSVLRTEGR